MMSQSVPHQKHTPFNPSGTDLTATNVEDAIKEVNGSDTNADDVVYDNTESGLVSNNVQNAIDELAEGGVEIPYFDTQAEADAAIVNGDLDEGDYYAVGEDSLYHMEYDAENETLIVSDSLISYDSETETITFNI